MADARTIGIIGGSGRIGRAVGQSLLSGGIIEPGSLILSSRSGNGGGFAEWPDVQWAHDNQHLADLSDVILIAVRPAQFSAIEIEARGKLVISVMAGIPIASLRKRTQSEQIVRAMPNAAAEIGRSYTPWIASENVSTADKAFVQAIFETCGVAAEQRNEADINYLTGLTGSGPAFPALFADALLSHALSRGLEAQTARQAVHGVITGAFHLFAATGRSPGEVVADFLSYRGTTAAGLQAMTDAGFITAVSVGLDAAEDAAARIGEV